MPIAAKPTLNVQSGARLCIHAFGAYMRYITPNVMTISASFARLMKYPRCQHHAR